ncbi:unnamed protein product [Sphagnum balticum]
MVLSTCLVGDLVLSPAPCFMSLLPRSMTPSSPPQPFKLTACAPAPCFMGSPLSMASSAPLQAVKLKAWAPICHASSAVQSDLPLAQPVPMRSIATEESGIQPLLIGSIRESLIEQEDTLIYSLLQRAQYCYNAPTYDKNCFAIPGFEGSLIEYMLQETEHLHAKVRRYSAPDEHPFFPIGLPEPILPPLQQIKVLHPAADSININRDIWSMYYNDLLPKIVAPGDDGNYGSASVCDVLCLQALSKRIHYGKFVAEAKFTQDPEKFEPHIKAQDADAIMAELTYKDVEDNVRRRVAHKARTYGQEVNETGRVNNSQYKIDPELVGALYEHWVMPLTKNVQVAYLLRRLD